MDCQYIQQNELHEKYLLDRLSDTEKREYEEHIEACDSCREELVKQRMLIAGIQAAGRTEMKQQIRTQVGKLRKKPVTDSSNWQMILKAAAVLFIIALIPSAIYYFRTDSGQPMARLIKPESTPTPERSVEPQEPRTEAGASKKGEVQPRFYPSAAAIDSERTDGDRQFADKISDEDLPTIASAPRTPAGETASGGMGGSGAARIHQEILGESETTASLSAQSTTATNKMNEKELQSKLMVGDRYQFAEGESKGKKIPGLESEEPAERKFDALKTQEFVRDLGTSSKKSIQVETQIMTTAVFRSGQKMISVDFVPPARELIMNKKYDLPQSFEVEILDRDSLDWNMIWHITKESIPFHLSELDIIIEGKTLYVVLPTNKIYIIAVDEDTTKAVLMEK